MSQLRQDPLSERWVVMAQARSDRPQQLAPRAMPPLPGRCPFCAGHEDDTPEASAVYPSRDAWDVRVVPNKFPAVVAGDEFEPQAPGPYGWQAAYGRHEVVIESRTHLAEFSQVDVRVAPLTFRAYRDRLLALAHDPRIGYVQIFKNSGAAAGASLVHTHSQILATTTIPSIVQHELLASARWHAEHRDCLLCHIVRYELAARERIVHETERFVAYCPFASRFPYELCVVPRRHAGRFEDADDETLDELASCMHSLLACVRRLDADVAYNYLLHSTPLRSSLHASFHWHWEILPRMTPIAGYELGTGYFINPVPPEEAAARLRTLAS